MPLTSELRAANRESWSELLAFVDRLPDEGPWLEWKFLVRPVVVSAISAGIDEYFRAGHSMSHLIFSTAEEHGLERLHPPPPRVALGAERNRRWYRKWEFQLFVAYSHWNIWNGEPERKDFAHPDAALATLEAYLSELWAATRPDEPVPAVVVGAHPA
jgi:hypothetical protein